MLRILWMSCVLASIPIISLTAEEPKAEQAHPQESLETVIPYTLKLVEQKNFREF